MEYSVRYITTNNIPSLATDYLKDFSREPDLFSDRVGELRFIV